MLANELIDRLERRGLLDQEIIEALREQLTEGGARVTPEAVAKLLVDNGQLTRFQATKLIGELRSEDYDDAEVVEVVEDDLAMIESVDDPMEVDDVFDAEPIMAEAEPVAVAAEPVVVEAEPVSAQGGQSAAASGERPARRTPTRIKPPEQKTIWDSFKVYGYLGIIGFLIIAGSGFYWILTKQNADDVIGIANKKYDAQSYQPAQEDYISFLASFGQENQYSSLARTRITMCELYRGEQMSDSVAALDLAKDKLPGIIDEEGMNEERGNLAALLVDIAENIVTAAGAASETAEKQRLLDRFDEQWGLIQDPNYMLSSMKTTLEGRLTQLTEARNRVKRDITRNIRLDETEAAMMAALAEKNTKEAYDNRKSLLRDFPELAVDERLTKLIAEASDMQQSLVVPSKNKPEPLNVPSSEDSIRSIALTTRQGDSINGLERDIFYLRAGGSVMAFSAYDGRLLWRKFTGYGEDHTPIRLDDGDAVLLSDMSSNEVKRFEGKEGKLQWRSAIEETFVEPIAGKDSILISAKSGRLISLDSETGDPNWVTQIPQLLTTPAGLDDKLRRVYVPGDHSNLYTLDSRTGKCLDSFYIGHEEGTIAVAPVSLLGHLFVIENAGADYSQVHVLRMDEKGGNLKVAQPPFRMAGNVIVPPIVQKQRRIIVLTDRGQVAVYDIEPTVEQKQVNSIAEQPPYYDTPTLTRMAVGNSQMWITGRRVGRYELQINTGRVVYDWGKAEGDTFVGQPLAFDDALIHARVLRGTSAIRVVGAEPKTGNEIWRTDVGTPISMLVRDKSGIHAVTSQGALFELDKDAITSGATQGPIENPGANSIKMNFTKPINIDDVRWVLLNESQLGEAMVYDPTRRSEKLRKITFNLTGPKPTGVGVFAGDGIFLPLDSGRAVVMDWQTGKTETSNSRSSPFQPLSDPMGKVTWTNPVKLMGNGDQVVIADSRKKIYRLRVNEQITENGSADLEMPFLGRTVGIDGKFIGGASGPAADFLLGYELNSLDQKFKNCLMDESRGGRPKRFPTMEMNSHC